MNEDKFQNAIADLDLEALKAKDVDIRFFAGSEGAEIWFSGLNGPEGNTVSVEFPAEAVDHARLAFRLLTTALL